MKSIPDTSSAADRVIRATGPSCVSASVPAGRIMLRNQPMGSAPSATYPPVGSHPSFTPTTQISTSPSQKSGSDSPTSAVPIVAWSTHRPDCDAASSPSGIPTRQASDSDNPASDNVTGSRSKIAPITLWFSSTDRPRSARSNPPYHCAIRASGGRSSPSSWRSRATSAGVADMPSISAAMSPGTSKVSPNATSEITISTGTAASRRRAISRNKRRSPQANQQSHIRGIRYGA